MAQFTEEEKTIRRIEKSRNYPYVKLNAGYGYTFNKYETNATSRRSNWGLNGGITVGINLWDGNRRREKRNASLQIRNSQLEREQLELGLKADLSNLWQAYRNNLRLLNLERQNLVAARENHEIAKERYLSEMCPVSRCVKPKKVCLMRKNVFYLLNITPKSVKFPCSN